MKKMTLAMMITALIVGFHTAAYSGHTNRAGYVSGNKGTGTIRVAGQGWTKHQKKRRCKPALINVWLNDKVTTVQVTTCRKDDGWIVSPIYINVGKQSVNHRGRSSWRGNHSYGGVFYPNPPVPWFGR